MTSGILIAAMLVLFPALVAWAWSTRRREAFDQAAALALEPAVDTLPAEDSR
ncbi:cbb3-type cytochrome oxidase subunit 3 [Dokdonella fugitiva]|uniref:Cbb3-type cytochrome oxidase subunit 3 n=1 Tax=Dokdonella fugitiva TaxID=328517 RepID=A0A839F5F0_9GAMM|nr:CcoQ/FixQ family Cbb3-type cytochrome c oxidase assembly chaperone [Dokdonella fugitiva]MBA8887474.1 cbb3-type cytochrome oxidase subunit 3 [Dokdonella fugitiva]